MFSNSDDSFSISVGQLKDMRSYLFSPRNEDSRGRVSATLETDVREDAPESMSATSLSANRSTGEASATRVQLPPSPKVSVVIPAMNEARNLPHVFERLPHGLHEVVLVDGRSTDGTPDVARQLYPSVKVISQRGRGKGDALAAGFAACTGDIIVMLDADGSADAGEIPLFVGALEAGADFAKGSRFLQGGGSADITHFRSLGNRCLNILVNVLHRTRYTDLCYGYNAFWRRHLPVINVDCDGFEVETLINLRIAKAGLAVREVPSFEYHRIHGVSNLRAIPDGCRVLRTSFAEHFNRQRTESKEAVYRKP